jgi:hypothetical protein
VLIEPGQRQKITILAKQSFVKKFNSLDLK